MVAKPDGTMCAIREQIIEDQASGLTIQFESMPGSDAPVRMRIFADNLPYGNREILFDQDGREAGAGTFLAGLCRPTWLTEVND